MSAGMYGAVPDQLSALGKQLQGQVEAINAIQGAVMTSFAATTWEGPSKAEFQGKWDSQFNPALNGLKESLMAAGSECCSRALGLAQVMGATAAST